MSDKNAKSATELFNEERRANVQRMGNDQALRDQTLRWIEATSAYKYTYHFTWLGRPIIQFPQDIIAIQELIWKVNPDLVIETGIAHGGSLILSASMLALLEICGYGKNKRVIGIDIEIREHNRVQIDRHPLRRYIDMIEGSSTSADVFEQVKHHAAGSPRVMVFLDSNHTHEHVLSELIFYAPLVTVGSYCVVFDTLIEDMPETLFVDRPWGRGNNPKTAVSEFLKDHSEFRIDNEFENKLLITVAPCGFLHRTR